MVETDSDLTHIERPLILGLSASEEPLRTQNTCWQSLFHVGVVANVERVTPKDRSTGKGLCVSFDTMIALTSVEYPVAIHKTVILVGYRTVLIAVAIEQNFVQYHVEVSKSGQINPYLLDFDNAADVEDINILRQRRCFIGWCANAHIFLGTRDLISTTRPRHSQAKEKERTLQMHGLSLGLQAVSCAPFQAGANLQVSGIFITNRVRFSYAEVYSQLLRNATVEIVLLHDHEERRAWLVPKLSLLLHVAHLYMKIREASDPIPFVSGHEDAKELVGLYENRGDMALFGSGQDAFRFRTLLQGLNINMLRCVEKTEEASARKLYGFELLDILTESGKGSCMKQMSIGATGRDLLPIARLADAIVIGAGFGDVIGPVKKDYKSRPCNTVPQGFDYLTAHISCLNRLLSRHEADTNKRFYEIPH